MCEKHVDISRVVSKTEVNECVVCGLNRSFFTDTFIRVDSMTISCYKIVMHLKVPQTPSGGTAQLDLRSQAMRLPMCISTTVNPHERTEQHPSLMGCSEHGLQAAVSKPSSTPRWWGAQNMACRPRSMTVLRRRVFLMSRVVGGRTLRERASSITCACLFIWARVSTLGPSSITSGRSS